jgi:hypothetical protein
MERTQNVTNKQTFSTFSNILLSYKNEDIDEIEVRFDSNILDIFKPGSSSGVDVIPTNVWRPETHVVVLKDVAS